jgi:hypothetical protein
MRKMIFLLLLFCSSVKLSNAQFFKNGKGQFRKIENSWNSLSYELFLEDYPKSKYANEIRKRLICTNRNKEYSQIIISKDTTTLKTYLIKFDTCSFCQNYLPNAALGNLGNGSSDLISINDSLVSKRSFYFWENRLSKSDLTDFGTANEFILKFPKSYLVPQALDSMRIRKDRYFWQKAKVTDNAQGYKMYIDSVQNGIYSKEALEFYQEYELGEKLLASNTHTELAIGLRKLRTNYPGSKFISPVNKKMESIEKIDFANNLKKRKLISWLEFEKKYTDGYYFKEADKKIRALLKLSYRDVRSPYGTFVELNNELADPIRFVFIAKGVQVKQMKIKSHQINGMIIPNGEYHLKIFNEKTNAVIIDDTLIFDGIPKTLTP